MFKIGYGNIDLFKNALDGTWERNKAITHNMANENTPNYKRKVVTFEDQLKQSMTKNKVSLRTTNEKHIGIGTSNFAPRVETDKTISYRIGYFRKF